ncbi:hypothetical protein [Rhodococcus opacus]|uniref:hypothetical protein n=1 Tax=Rhodococcus opacus TaxID=37919 RepID=UPI00374EE53A
MLTLAGAITVKVPGINDQACRPGRRRRPRFSSAILPVWVCKSAQVSEALQVLYVHGLSSRN